MFLASLEKEPSKARTLFLASLEKEPSKARTLFLASLEKEPSKARTLFLASLEKEPSKARTLFLASLEKGYDIMKKKKTSDIFSLPKAGVNDLILFGIYSVTENQEKCTFERLLKECFDLFPQMFGFSKYPKWPDSRKLDRPLRLLRDRKLISGDPQTYFLLTKAGERVAEDIAKTFHQRKLFK